MQGRIEAPREHRWAKLRPAARRQKKRNAQASEAFQSRGCKGTKLGELQQSSWGPTLDDRCKYKIPRLDTVTIPHFTCGTALARCILTPDESGWGVPPPRWRESKCVYEDRPASQFSWWRFLLRRHNRRPFRS